MRYKRLLPEALAGQRDWSRFGKGHHDCVDIVQWSYQALIASCVNRFPNKRAATHWFVSGANTNGSRSTWYNGLQGSGTETGFQFEPFQVQKHGQQQPLPEPLEPLPELDDPESPLEPYDGPELGPLDEPLGPLDEPDPLDEPEPLEDPEPLDP